MIANTAEKCFGEKRENLWGLYPALAKNVIDDEGQARVTLIFNWISDTFESKPAHVCQLYAGSEHGTVWTPEEGDQCIVAFLNGQITQPVVLGSIYTKRHLPQQSRSESSDPKLFLTKGGHYILMEDGNGKRIEISDKDGTNKVIIDTEKNNIDVSAEANVTVNAKGNITLDATGDLTIKAGGSVNVSGTTINLN